MNNARKSKIEYNFIINADTDLKELRNLEIQELIFLILSSEYFQQTKVFDVDFDKKLNTFKVSLKKKIKGAESIFIICHQEKDYPYIDEEDRVLFFSKEEYAEEVQMSLPLKEELVIKVIKGSDLNEESVFLHRIGIEKILIDKGQYEYEINRGEMKDEEAFPEFDDGNIAVENPQLMHACIKYFQALAEKSRDEEEMAAIEDELFREIIAGSYIVPVSKDKEEQMKFEEENKVPFGTVKGPDDKEYLAVFTDMEELGKAFAKDSWNIHVLAYDDIKVFPEDEAGFVINSASTAVFIDEDKKVKIEKIEAEILAAEKTKIKAAKAKEEKEKTKIITPETYPFELIRALKKYMRHKKDINKAYLREVKKNEDVSYLVVIDHKGDEGELFKGICNAAIPYLKGRNIDVADIHSAFGSKAAANVEAFYNKSFFDYLKKFAVKK